jgi:hypothetical protein
MHNRLFSGFLWMVLVGMISSCGVSIGETELYGRWNYTKVENIDGSQGASAADLRVDQPYIEFGEDHRLKIVWAGEQFSSGTYRIDGNKIQYKETLEDGSTREFPFLVTSFDGREIRFETLVKGGSRVTAKKAP